jgi:hypothetical protein
MNGFDMGEDGRSRVLREHGVVSPEQLLQSLGMR